MFLSSRFSLRRLVSASVLRASTYDDNKGMIHSADAPGTLDGTALGEPRTACIAKNPMQLGKP
jgi:hypothetical protein